MKLNNRKKLSGNKSSEHSDIPLRYRCLSSDGKNLESKHHIECKVELISNLKSTTNQINSPKYSHKENTNPVVSHKYSLAFPKSLSGSKFSIKKAVLQPKATLIESTIRKFSPKVKSNLSNHKQNAEKSLGKLKSLNNLKKMTRNLSNKHDKTKDSSKTNKLIRTSRGDSRRSETSVPIVITMKLNELKERLKSILRDRKSVV